MVVQQHRSWWLWRNTKDGQFVHVYPSELLIDYLPHEQYPSWTGRRDKRGIPLYVYRIADLNSKAMKTYEANVMTPSASPYQSGSSTPVKTAPAGTTPVAPAATTPPKLLRLFALYQNMASFVFPMCNAMHRPNMETPISATTNISDVTYVLLWTRKLINFC